MGLRDRGEAIENRADDEVAIDRVGERAAHPDVGKCREPPLVERHVLVGIARRAMHGEAGHAGNLAVLVPRHRPNEVHLAGLQLIDACVRVGEELEEQLCNLRSAAPVAVNPLEKDVSPVFHSATLYGPVPKSARL